MHPGQATKIGAACCGLAGFAVGVIAGLAVDNPADVVLARAIVAMIVCNIVGWVFGITVERVFKESVSKYGKQRVESAAASVRADDEAKGVISV